MHFQKILSALFSILLLTFSTIAYAQDTLTVATPERSQSFTFEDLRALPQTTIVTKNDYINEANSFEGPSLRLLIEHMGIARDATLTMGALNDFLTDIPAADAFDYDTILALLQYGKTMSIRDKGPIWIIYPIDDNPELDNDLVNSKLIWQLRSITVN